MEVNYGEKSKKRNKTRKIVISLTNQDEVSVLNYLSSSSIL